MKFDFGTYPCIDFLCGNSQVGGFAGSVTSVGAYFVVS